MTESTAHRLHLPIRLGPRQRRWAYLSFALLWLSGALWLVFHYFLQVPGTFGPHPHPLEHWWLRLHGLTMMTSLLMLGSLFLHHLHRAWQLRRNRLLGGVLTCAFAWLGATGYALFYFSSDANQAWLPLLHWIPGLLLPGMLVFHIRRGRRRVSNAPTVACRMPSRPRSSGERSGIHTECVPQAGRG